MAFRQKYWWLHSIAIIYIAILFTITATKIFNETKTDQNLYQDFNNFCYIDKDIIAIDNSNNSLDTLSSNSLITVIDSAWTQPLDSLSELIEAKDIHEVVVLHLKPFGVDTFSIHKKYLTPEYLTFHEVGVLVTQVFENGVSAEAGLEVGDIILEVNYHKVNSAKHADEIMFSTEEGGKIHYGVLRNGEMLEIPVDVVTLSVKIYAIIYFAIGLLVLILGLFIGLRRPKIKAARLVSLSLVMIGALLANGFDPTEISNNSISTLDILARISWMIIATFAYPVSLHTLFYFPNENKRMINKKWLYKLLYLVVPLVFLTSNILLSTVFAEYLYLAGKIYSITSVAIFAYMGIVILMLLFSTDIENMQKVKPIYISHIILLLVIAAKTSIRIFFSDVEIMASNDLSNANALLMFALPLPFAYYMTIGNYHLLDLNIRFSRNILYVTAVFILRVVLTSIFLIAGYKLITLNWEFPNVVFSRTVVSLTDTPASSELQKTMEHIAIFISLIAVLAFLRYIMKIAQERIDGLFNKVNVDFRTLSARLGQIAKHGENNTDELVNTVVNTIATGMMLKKASVWLFNDEKLVSHKYFGITLNAQLAEFANLYSNDILNEMLKFKAPAPVDYLSAEVKSVLTDCSFEYVILLSTKEKNIGLLLIGEKLLESKFTKEDLTFLSDIAEHTAVVLENALMRRDIIKQERLKNEVELARKIQMASMPKASASIPGLDTAAVSKPAYEVGGDFFDFYRQQETKLAVIVGDVSGKGTSAALYMTNALGIVRTLSNFTISPRDILCNMNAIIKKQIKKGNFITAVTAEADTDRKEISISRAGHNPVFHFKAASKEIVQYKPNGLALGLTGSSTFDKVLQEQTISYNEGDIFVFITDGMCEARNENDEEVGDSIIYSVLNSYHESSAEEILKTMMHHLEKISLGNYVDDVTALIIKSV